MNDRYESPLCERYAGEKMQRIFSADNKFSTWRKLWIALAESEKELGLDISDEQIEEMKALYDLCSIILARYFPAENADDNFITLNFLSSVQYPMRIFINKDLARVFSILGEYEKWEERITAIQQLFFEYKKIYPKLYEEYNLEELATEKISTILWSTRDTLAENPEFLFEVMERWKLR